MKKIDTVEEFDQLLEGNDQLFFLKHSLTCPISQAAFEEYEKFVSENQDVEGYYLAVQDSRPLSNHISEQFQIKHESPQAFLFKNKDVAWNASHWKITFDSLTSAIKENK